MNLDAANPPPRPTETALTAAPPQDSAEADLQNQRTDQTQTGLPVSAAGVDATTFRPDQPPPTEPTTAPDALAAISPRKLGGMAVATQMRVLLLVMLLLTLLFFGALAVFEWQPYVRSAAWVDDPSVSPRLVIGFLCIAFFLAAAALVRLALAENRRQIAATLARAADARQVEFAAQQANLRSEAAVLRLMGELQQVADGDLTVRATAGEDVTGAIADTVNRTLDELRFLVGRINQAAAQVAEASMIASEITAALLQASEQQSREIKSTGQKVLSMSTQIQEASRSASASALAARASLDAAEHGAAAVQDQIAGMQGIREQIQNTAKRIKRLGESSQEIGEIVEMISDIAERTHVLALNAAIQAASAGESRRGFTVVAEEVQTLADRTADAARQIGTLIHAIQLDTHDAVAAMERSTQDVVKGARLSDAAGTSLIAIGRVTRQVTDLIESVARTTEAQAHSATDAATSIERILAVTDDTYEGTRRTAGSIGTLAALAQELKASVARFRVQ